MIYKSILTVMMILLAVNLKSQSKVDVEFNPNIATYSIVEYLVAKEQGRLFYIDGKTDISYLPLADLANKEIEKYDNSKIIKAMQDYLKTAGQQQDLSYQVLLKHHVFPAKRYAYPIEETDNAKKEAVEKFAEQLREFYIERNLEKFFKDQSHFLEGAKNEVRKNIPASYMSKMEKYYGQKFLAYKFYINPFDVLPYSEVFWHGNGPMFRSEKGQVANMISSAYVPLEKKNNIKDYKEFGFNHPETTNFLITHEFGHSFVNQYLGKYEILFNKGLIKNIDIRKEDINELNQFNPLINWCEEHELEIGRNWKFRPHQFRRSLVVYGVRSGMIQLSVLKKQLQHLSIDMTTYYGNYAGTANNLFDESILEEFKEENIRYQFVQYERKVINSTDTLFGGEGTRLHLSKRLENVPEYLIDKEKTLQYFNEGRMAYKKTPLGGCSKIGACDKLGFSYITACIDCKDSIFDSSSKVALKKTKQAYFDRLKKYDFDSVTYKQLQIEINSINKILNKVEILEINNV